MAKIIPDTDPLFDDHIERVLLAAEWFKKHIPGVPDVAIITGSSGPHALEGFFVNEGGFSEKSWTDHAFPESLPRPTAHGHGKTMRIGYIGETRVLWIKGRVHFYERSTNPFRHIAMVRALGLYGVKNLILTNAAGSLNPRYQPTSICIVSDVDPTYMGHAPLGGDLEVIVKHFGPPFPAMNPGLDPKFQELALAASAALPIGALLHDKVGYTAIPAPPFESALQARNFPKGDDLSGMSSIPELMAAQQLGMRTVLISLVTNMISREILALGQGVTHEAVLGVVKGMDGTFASYLAKLTELIGEEVRGAVSV